MPASATPPASPSVRPISAPEHEGASATARQFVRYAFFKPRASWPGLSAAQRAGARADLLVALEPFAARLPVLRAYSTIGTRADCDFLLWVVSERLDDLQDVQAAVLRSAMGAHLQMAHSFLAMTKRSQYVDTHVHEGQEGRRTRIRPTGRKYLFVYPLVKKRPWYALPADERQRIMAVHIKVGHEFPRVKINTTYSFGLDDQEFVVAFETDHPADFLDLVEALRGTESSAYTERETPIFTCIAGSIADVLEVLG